MSNGCEIVTLRPNTPANDTSQASGEDQGGQPSRSHCRPRSRRVTGGRTKRMQIDVQNFEQCRRDMALWRAAFTEAEQIASRDKRSHTEADKMALIRDLLERAGSLTAPAQPRSKVS